MRATGRLTRHFALLAVLALPACESVGPEAVTAPRAEGARLGPAIMDGAPDGNGHPNVGMVVLDPDGPGGVVPPFGLCSGFVVSDRVFVTAAHCIAVNPAASWAVHLEPGAPGMPVGETGIFPDDFPFFIFVPVVYADEVVMHPQFGNDPQNGHDVAVLLFPAGTFAGVTPVELPEEGALDALAAAGGLVGSDFTLVGYGATPLGGFRGPRAILGYRQVATAPFQGLSQRWLHLQMTTQATDQGALCSGDSGSPQFLEDDDVALSLTGSASGNKHCGVGINRNQRLDTPEEVAFLAQFLE